MENMDSSWSLGNADLLQQMGMLAWMNSGDTDLLQKVTGARVCYELFQRMSGERDVEALRNQTIMTIVKYVKDHPKASKEELTKEISKQIWLFAQKVQQM